MLSLVLPTPPLKLSPGKDILYFTEELVSYVGSVGKVQVKGLHPEQMSLCCTSRGKWEGVSWNQDNCANSHRKGSSGWGKASKNESPVWRDVMLVLLLVGLGLTHLSWTLLENNSGDTASRKDHWRGSRLSQCSSYFQLSCGGSWSKGRLGPLLQWVLWYRQIPAGKRVAWPGQQC